MGPRRQDASTMRMASEERRDFLDLLEGLSPQQWGQPSLCKRWRVKDVVAHVLSYDELSRAALLRRFAKGWFVASRVNAVGVAEYSTRSPEQLAKLMRACYFTAWSHRWFRRHDRVGRWHDPPARHSATVGFRPQDSPSRACTLC